MIGDYDPDNPVIIPQKKDIRYRSWKEVKSPQSNAVIVFMMDVSGSMGEEQKELVRLESFWIDTWLRKNYEGIESRYIVHDVSAKEVDKHTFYHLREDGGTKISSAFRPASNCSIPTTRPDEWNIYLFHFSDGDNSSEADSRDCVKILKEQLLPICNMFGYCQVASAYGSGNFINVLHEHLREPREGADEPGELEGRYLRFDQDVFWEGALMTGPADAYGDHRRLARRRRRSVRAVARACKAAWL